MDYESPGPGPGNAMTVSTTTFSTTSQASAALQGGLGGAIAFLPAAGAGA